MLNSILQKKARQIDGRTLISAYHNVRDAAINLKIALERAAETPYAKENIGGINSMLKDIYNEIDQLKLLKGEA